MELLTLILIPLIIEPTVQWLKNTTTLHPLFLVAVFSAIGGTAFVAWQYTPENIKEWTLIAYPIFAAGAIATHKFIRPFFNG